MDASLDNANNPFAVPNGAATDNIISQKSDGLLLNLTDNFKQNGPDLSPAADFYQKEKSNGKRSASVFDDDDFGPETNVDAVDDALSPIDTAKGFGAVFSNNNPAEGVYNPFMEHQEKAALEIERELQKQQTEEFEEQRMAREETPTPPADAVHDVSGLADNTADSESEDEWNYFKGDDANKENISSQPDKEVAAVPEEDDNMSQLNPDAAEFVPISPTRSIPSPACRTLIHDQVISQSPRRPVTNEIDINVPNQVDFEKEVKSRPSEVDSYSNGHDDSDINIKPTDLMENLLNGKNIDEIPEFQPGSTPSKPALSEEFHFGPNAAPFTPSKFLDQSETALSTKAVYGDESTATLGMSFNESEDIISSKESDPMSMSFYANKGDNNPFDLNEVQMLPDNIDEFLKKPDTFNETISDLPEHYPLGEPADVTVNNDDAIQTTDLDKPTYDDEKELASPLEPEKELSEADKYLLTGGAVGDFSRTPEPTYENLLGSEFCQMPEKCKIAETDRDIDLILPEPRHSESSRPESAVSRPESDSPRLVESISRPESSHEDIVESKSPLLETSEVNDLLQTQPESLPRDVELISPVLNSSRLVSATHEEEIKSPLPEALEVADLLPTESKSPLPEATERLLQADNKSSVPELIEDSVISESKSPEVYDLPQSKTPTSDILEAKSPVCERYNVESPVCDLPESKSLVCELPQSKSPLPQSESSVCELPMSPICDLLISKAPVCELEATESPVYDISASKSPVPEEVCSLGRNTASPAPAILSPDFTKPEELLKADQHFEIVCISEKDFGKTEGDFTSPEVLEHAQEYFDEMFKPKAGLESPQEETTCSLKDEISLPKSPVPNQVIEDSFTGDQSMLGLGVVENVAGIIDDSIIEAVSSPVPEEAAIGDTESVVTTDMNSFLERSLPPDVASPLSPAEQELDDMKRCMYPGGDESQQSTEPAVPDVLPWNHALMECAYPLPIGEQIDIKTENITPEFPEQTIVTPSEESKQDNVPTAPPVEEPVKEPTVEENKVEEPASAPILAAAGVAVAAEVAVAAVATIKHEKKPGVSPTKRATSAKSTPKTTTKATPTPKPNASRLSASPKLTTAKTGTAKPLTSSAPKPMASAKPLPKRPTPAPKSTEKKPVANGDIKSIVKSTLTSKRLSEITVKPSAPRPATAGATKSSPTKIAATPRPASTRPATAPRTTTTRTSTTTTNVAPKPRPTTLTSKTATSVPKTTATPKPITKTSPKMAAAVPAPRSRPPLSTTLMKPRVPLTKTVSKAPPDTEKQNKESANKLTASRTVTSTTRTASSTPRTISSATRRVESRVTATRTSKMTTTTMKSTTAKKPAELVRHTTTKTKTTKIEKPKENGVSTVVTEEISINNMTPLIDNESRLLKDNSPVDNKLIVENTLIQTNTAD